MAIQKEVVVVDASTGEIYGPRPRKIKRTEPFFMTYQEAAKELAKSKFTGMELRVLLYLQSIADYDNVAQITQAFLAKELDTTEATISISIKHLVEKDAITTPVINGRKAFKISSHISTRGKAK
jgi:hypothetical protein